MNKERRNRLNHVLVALDEQRLELENIQSDEQESYDNMPESLQYSERAEAIQENIDDLDSCISDLDNIIENLQDIVDR